MKQEEVTTRVALTEENKRIINYELVWEQAKCLALAFIHIQGVSEWLFLGAQSWMNSHHCPIHPGRMEAVGDTLAFFPLPIRPS